MPPPRNLAAFIASCPKRGRDNIGKDKLTPQEKYDKSNTQFIGLKLNKKSDKDILDALEGKPKQTEIKRLVRKGLETEQK